MKSMNKIALMLPVAAMMSSCNGWLAEETPGNTKLEDFMTGGETAIQVVNACYTPFAWEYGVPGGYFSEWYFGDIASDDALKGGQDLADGAEAYDIDNFKVNANNQICLGYYRAKYQGIGRCNLALQEIEKFEPDDVVDSKRKECLLGEAYFMRGMYYFQLVRVFGGVPVVDFVIDSSDRWQQPRASVDEVYEQIISDFEKAEQMLWNKSDYASTDLGRATKGAAQAMLLKANLYRKNYDEAYKWGKKFIEEQYGAQYQLMANYRDNFTMAGENGVESVLEVQYMADPTSDYGSDGGGMGFTRGTFTTILVRPRLSSLGSNKGWGWNHPTQNLYDEYEAGDIRREATIGIPSDADLQDVEVTYLGSPYYNLKYSYYEDGRFAGIDHDSRSPFNYRVIRLSDVLLLYAEACLESGKDLGQAKWALEQVRARARANSAPGSLPAFPAYGGYSDNVESLRAAIRHERRVELGMEGHRWFDLVRWGIAKQVMDKDTGSYGKNESEEARREMANFVEGKHELFPIPAEEINLNPMAQNPGY